MKTLGITSPIDPERPLAEFGLNSLMSVTLLNRLEVPLGVKMSAAKLIQGPSVRQLAEISQPNGHQMRTKLARKLSWHRLRAGVG